MNNPLNIAYYSQAPLRISFAGGGTDVSPYCDEFGGAVVNACIQYYAHVTLKPTAQTHTQLTMWHQGQLSTDPKDIEIFEAVINYMRAHFGAFPSGFSLKGQLDVAKCSGLGSSSALVVACVSSFLHWLQVPRNPMEIAAMAVAIERHWMQWPGGRQDQYAAALGGINFMEFRANEHITVTPIRLYNAEQTQLESRLLLYYSGIVRSEQRIIETQQAHAAAHTTVPLQAMHRIRQQAFQFRTILESGDWTDLGTELHAGFIEKKKMAEGISNAALDEIYEFARQHGATGGKISGAGGGGFFFFYVPEESYPRVADALTQRGGQVLPLRFTMRGVETKQTVLPE